MYPRWIRGTYPHLDCLQSFGFTPLGILLEQNLCLFQRIGQRSNRHGHLISVGFSLSKVRIVLLGL